jgi:hypothetical protein
MSPEQMFSLFAGFVAASFLIWFSNIVGGRRKGFHPIPDQGPEAKNKSRNDSRIQESYWNVSTFFGLKN